MATTARPMTYEGYAALPDDGRRHEVIGGRLVEVPSPSPQPQEFVGRLYVLLLGVLAAGRLGRVYLAPLDVRLGPHDIVQPDLLVVLANRVQIVGPAFVDGAPDLLVEIVSPSTRARDEGAKLALFARAGVPEVWHVDPEAGTLAVLTLDDGAYVAQPGEERVARSAALPGLAVDLEALFADLA